MKLQESLGTEHMIRIIIIYSHFYLFNFLVYFTTSQKFWVTTCDFIYEVYALKLYLIIF